MSTLRILGRANSFNVRKVLWVSDELGLTYTREDWGRGFRPASDPEFLALNPLAMVPCVIDDGHVLRESNTIIRYLASKYGAGRGGDVLYPADPLRRAGIEQWMDWANYETSISLRGAFLGGVLNEAPWNNPWFIETGRRQIAKEVGQLDARLATVGPYVTGADFTLADIPIGLVVNRWFALMFDGKPDYVNVARYFEQLSTRPAYMQHVRNGLP